MTNKWTYRWFTIGITFMLIACCTACIFPHFSVIFLMLLSFFFMLPGIASLMLEIADLIKNKI